MRTAVSRVIPFDKMGEQTFEAVVHREGSFTFVAIPFSPREVWGAKPRYHVVGTINGYAVRGCLGALKRSYFLRLGAAWIRDSGVQPGESVRVRLAADEHKTAAG